MRKTAAFFLAVLMTVSICAGCGAGQGTGPDLQPEENGGERTPAAEPGEEETAEPGEESGPKVYEHFTGGTLYEEGEYFFRVDSMGMTEEGYEIQYTARTDRKGYKASFDMSVIVNGIRTFFDGNTFYNDTEAGRKGSSSMLPSTGSPARLVIGKEYLEKLGASEVNSLYLHVELGMSAYNSITVGADLEYMLYPGDAVDTEIVFPEPERESWVLADNEYGKVQILRAAYREDSSGHALVHAFVLAYGVGGDDFPRYGVKVSPRRTEGKINKFYDSVNSNYTMLPGAVLYEALLYDVDIPFADCEEGFLSPVVITIEVSGSGEKETVETVLDFTHLEYEGR